jgi:TfoX/Sxy family transcriptional regulator of competence genes
LPYSEALADRIRAALIEQGGVTERRMFGGLCVMVNGNMCVGVIGEELMVRVGPDAYEAALAEPAAREMDFTGKPLRGLIYVSASGVATDDDLAEWILRALAFVSELPPK